MNENGLFPYSACRLCGRACGVARDEGMKGFCGEGPELRAAWAGIHKGEEPPITGKGGSGTIFFTGCTLKCFFCQNHQISREGIGKVLTRGEFAGLCLRLQKAGAENINLVTASHFAPSVAEGLAEAKSRGLTIPVLWNSSGYDSVPALELLSPWVDVFLPDLKTTDPVLGEALFGLSDYPETAARALLWMAERRRLRYKGGVLRSGVIVRHLVMPGLPENTEASLAWFAENLKGKALVSVMFQYTPTSLPANDRDLPGAWYRKVSKEEYDHVLDLLEFYGIENGFVQDYPDDEPCLPDFTRRDAFPEGLAARLWFYGDGD